MQIRPLAIFILFIVFSSDGWANPQGGFAEDNASTRSRPPVDPQISGELLRQIPPPQISQIIPNDRVVAGGIIEFRGQNLRVEDFSARIEKSRGVPLPVVSSSSTLITVRVPEAAVTEASALTYRFGSGPPATIASSYRVFPRPKFSNPVMRVGPRIGLPTEMDVTVSNYAGLENTEFSIGCVDWDFGVGNYRLPAGGSTGTVRIQATFRLSSVVTGTLSPTDRWLQLSGRKCDMTAKFSREIGRGLPTGISIQFPTITRYVIENTWDLHDYKSPSGGMFRGRADARKIGGCGPVSIGTAGTFPIGVVNHNNDLSFKVRNGVTENTCDFSAGPGLRIKPGWVITEVNWSYRVPMKGTASICHPSQGIYNFRHNPEHLEQEEFWVTCYVVDPVAQNEHEFRRVLERVILIGPPGQTWQTAFR
jgi:hypothetical protein